MSMQSIPGEKPVPAQTPDVILRTSHLAKNFGHLQAVKDLNIEVHRGDVFGFLGPNGAGKSTTVGMILNLVAPSGGTIELFGHNLADNPWAALRRIGAVIEEPAFYPYLSGWDNLAVLARSIGGISDKRISDVLQTVKLLERSKDRYSHYSMGMKQRLGIASTLLRDPELIILDEPTNGLDPKGTKEIRDLIPTLAHESRAVVLCSHLLHEVELVCNRVAIIKEGVTLANSPLEDLLRRDRVLEVKVAEPEKALQILQTIPWIKSARLEEGRLMLEAPAESGAMVNQALAEKGIFASELVSRSSSLESVFLELTGGESHD
jgi:ABC-2 type transport system ATP-binding protein